MSRWRSQIGATVRRLRGPAPLVLVALALTLLSWPYSSLEPQPGLDPSWRTGLDMSFQLGLDAGTDVAFSFGPLGFLLSPEYAFAWPARLSWAYLFALHMCLCVALLWALRRSFGSLLVATPIAFVIASLMTQESAPVLIFAGAICLVGGEVAPRWVPRLAAVAGAFTGMQLLGKLNVGITVLALCAVALVALRERRAAAAAWFAGGLVVMVLAGWLVTGQPLHAMPEYVDRSLQVISGYSQAMGFEEAGRAWEIWPALGLALMGIVLVALAGPPADRRARLALAAMWLVLAFTAFKSGFVRHDIGHANIFFATMLGGLAALPIARRWRALAGLALVLATTVLLASLSVPLNQLWRPIDRARQALDQGATLADGTTLNARIVAARERLKQVYAIDPRIVDALRDHTVHVDPWEINVVWAHQLRWRPLPVFQSYSAYTAGLDAANAAALVSADGPQRVLRQSTGFIDGRNPAWESPAAVRAMLCNFREVLTVATWQVLARTADRCSAPRLQSEARTRFGASITVPRAPTARSVVYMTIDGAGVAGLESIANLLRRAQERYVTYADNRVWRLIPGTAADGAIMRVAPAVDLKAPFALDQGTDRIVVTRGKGAQPSGELRVRFYAVDVR